MGYKTPNVVKTIVLPLDYDFLLGLVGTSWPAFVEEYKKRYGIDLNEIFIIATDAASVLLDIIPDTNIFVRCQGGVIRHLSSAINTYKTDVLKAVGGNLLVLDSSTFEGVENGLIITLKAQEGYSDINDLIVDVAEY